MKLTIRREVAADRESIRHINFLTDKTIYRTGGIRSKVNG